MSDRMREAWAAKDPRNYFCLCASGASFDVDGYAKQSPLPISQIWRRGEPRAESDTVHEDSGITIELGSGADLDVAEQQSQAVEFLRSHRVAVEALSRTPGVTTFYLGLQEHVYPNSLGSILDLSPALMEIALAVGIQVTIWTCLGREPYGAAPE